MEKNKTGKYLKYAFGEILLVIVGIIIALQINNWNQNRLTQNRIDSRLSSLISDIDKEVDEMDEIIETGLNRILVTHEILKRNGKLKSAGWPESLPDSIKTSTTNNPNTTLSNLKTFDGNGPTYNELINSGEFYTLDNRFLTRKIQEYYGTIDELKDSERWGVLEMNLRISKSKQRLGIGIFSFVTLEELTEHAKIDKQFRAELESEINFTWLQIKNITELKQEALSLIEAIKSEIK